MERVVATRVNKSQSHEWSEKKDLSGRKSRTMENQMEVIDRLHISVIDTLTDVQWNID